MQRCSKHNIALSPQGECIVCKRETAAPAQASPPQANFAQAPFARAALTQAPLAQVPSRPSRWLLVRSLAMLSFAGWMLVHQILKSRSPAGIAVFRIPHSDVQTSQQHAPRGANETPSADDLRLARRQVSIVMYSASWCPSCKSARAYLANEGIPFEERDVEDDEAAGDRLYAINPKHTIPTFEIDNITVTNWSPQRLQSVIGQAALARWRRN